MIAYYFDLLIMVVLIQISRFIAGNFEGENILLAMNLVSDKQINYCQEMLVITSKIYQDNSTVLKLFDFII
jgi:hypothetical protein